MIHVYSSSPPSSSSPFLHIHSIPFPPFHEITRNSNSSKIANDIPLIDWEGDVAVERIGTVGKVGIIIVIIVIVMMQSYLHIPYLIVPLTDRFGKDRIWFVLCVCRYLI